MIAVLLALAIAGFAFYIREFFKIKEIVIAGSNNEKLKGLELLNGRFLPYVDQSQAESDLEKENPNLSDFKITKTWPDKVVVSFKKNPIAGALAVSGGYFYLNGNGIIVRKVRDLPATVIINFYQKLPYFSYGQGDRLEYRDLLAGLYFIGELKNLGFNVISVDIDGFSMIALHLKDKDIIFSSEKDWQAQTRLLQEVVGRLKIEGQDYKKLDFRFDKPVAEFKQA